MFWHADIQVQRVQYLNCLKLKKQKKEDKGLAADIKNLSVERHGNGRESRTSISITQPGYN